MSASNAPGISRRRVLGLAGAAAAATGLTACGSGAPESDSEQGGGKSGTFTAYWNPGHNYEAYQKVIKEFENDHDVTVRLQMYQWEELETRLLADLQAGRAPDVLEEPGGWAQRYALSGDALSLQKYLDEDGKAMGFPDDWQPAAVKHNTHSGEVYGIQLHMTCQLLVYNKEMFADAGVQPPTTWEEVVDVATELTHDGVYGLQLNQDQAYGWPWMLQNGVLEYDNRTKKVMQPQDAAIEALQFQADLVHRHKVSPVPVPSKDYSAPQKAFSAERAAMIVTGPWDLPVIEQSSPDLQFGIAQMPTGRRRATLLAGTSLFIPKKAPRPDLSWDFIRRMTTLETELAATKETGMLMPRKSWSGNPEVKQDADIAAFAQGLTYAQDAHPQTYLSGKGTELDQAWKTLYQSVLMTGKAVPTAYREYAEAARKLITD
ncbi:extracellular solute-binding protein [Streptomyces sp. KM273126]|uniref:sugar ABC transporter substrate-binding protein n=1 Tax=Streptomyces sp. KM273126 TaxID=2545247 RepID=UPI001039618A|nr:extracellular solute-binding protein [Streptomyces sp. KM273126]MBA2811290.1 extracellular solute-binding protein [Streptomyces sp. KM273126]